MAEFIIVLTISILFILLLTLIHKKKKGKLSLKITKKDSDAIHATAGFLILRFLIALVLFFFILDLAIDYFNVTSLFTKFILFIFSIIVIFTIFPNKSLRRYKGFKEFRKAIAFVVCAILLTYFIYYYLY